MMETLIVKNVILFVKPAMDPQLMIAKNAILKIFKGHLEDKIVSALKTRKFLVFNILINRKLRPRQNVIASRAILFQTKV